MYSFGPCSKLPGHRTALLFPLAASSYTQTPEDLFPGMSVSGTDLVIPIAALADYGLTAALAGPSTGDARALAYTFAARIEDWYTELSTATRPEALTATPRLTIAVTSGDFTGAEKTEIKIIAFRNRPEGTLRAEPS